MVRQRNKMILYSLVTILGGCIFFTGAGSIIGHLTGSEKLSAWFGDTKMAVSTSVTMILIGISFFMIGIDNLKK